MHDVELIEPLFSCDYCGINVFPGDQEASADDAACGPCWVEHLEFHGDCNCQRCCDGAYVPDYMQETM